MSRSISTAIAGSLTLSLTDPLASDGSDNPLTITSQGSVISTGSGDTPPPGIDGIFGPAGTAWVITNQGTVASATASGIALAGGGMLRNSGFIAGGTNVLDGVAATADGFSAGGPARVFNQGTIDGAGNDSNGVSLNGGGEVTNSGSITGFGEFGVDITGSGEVTNDRGGYIYGDADGVFVDGSAGIVTNQGQIGVALNSASVYLDDGGVVTNLAGGLIFAAKLGVVIGGKAGAVTNQGSIGGYEAAVTLLDGGQVANAAHAFMTGVEISGGSGSVINQGVLAADGGDGEPAVELAGGGALTNEGEIVGSAINTHPCVEITGGTVTNAGTISGSNISVEFDLGTTENRLIIDPGSVFTGVVDSYDYHAIIELAPGTGQVSAIGGGLYNGFATLVADDGGTWQLNGFNTIGTVLDNGVIDISGSLAVTQSADFGSAGVFQLVGASTLEIASTLAYQGSIAFAGGSELIIDHPREFGQRLPRHNYVGPILTNFSGATIDVKGFGINGLQTSFSEATGLLDLTNAAGHKATLEFQTSSLGAGAFQFTGDGMGGVFITLTPSSDEGTRIDLGSSQHHDFPAPHGVDLWWSATHAL